MANPTRFNIIPFTGTIQNGQLAIPSLYLHQIFGDDTNQSKILVKGETSSEFGQTLVNNWPIYDGLGPDANLVAHAQGMHMKAGSWYNSLIILFENDRYKGSTLQVMGATVDGKGDWAIVGGTGEFAMAIGVIQRKITNTGDREIQELIINGYCKTKVVPTPVKMGPWGRVAERRGDIVPGTKPQRLETITLSSDAASLYAFSFSYMDETGQIHNVGPWGSPGTKSDTIELGGSEFVTEISGATSAGGWLAYLKIVTNLRTLGTFGAPTKEGFKFVVPKDKTVVAFYGTYGGRTNSIGAYVVPK